MKEFNIKKQGNYFVAFDTVDKKRSYGKINITTKKFVGDTICLIALNKHVNELDKTTKLKKAFEHVKEKHPTLSIVIFDKNGAWQYMDENFESFKFDDTIDVSILEAASDSIETLPFIYQE